MMCVEGDGGAGEDRGVAVSVQFCRVSGVGYYEFVGGGWEDAG